MKTKVFLIVLYLTFLAPVAYASTGYIDPTAQNQAKVCHDTTCASPTPGIINFELSNEPSIVIDSATGISGRVWGNELGWIIMNPTSEGVSFANPSTGLLTGKAWSQVSGWINFNVTGAQVIIDPSTGEFDGWAWTGGPYGGWIKFDCSNASTCVRTTWRGTSGITGGGTSGGGRAGGSLPPTDVCPNIDGTQETIPSGYTVDQNGFCITIVDRCPNLAGVQEVVPLGYTINSMNACVATIATASDYCPNLSGTQSEIPVGYVISQNGNCIKPVTDVCANLSGSQKTAPDGFYLETENCFLLPKSTDTVRPPLPSGIVNPPSVTTPDTTKVTDNNSASFIEKITTAINNFIADQTSLSTYILIALSLLIFLLFCLLLFRYLR